MKDAYWFTHDANAKDDPKVLMLLDQLGLEGYGIFWILIETLRDQPQYRYPVKMIPILAKRYYTSGEKMMAVVRNYELFDIDNEQFFFSHSLDRRMQALDNKREIARLAGKASAEKRRQLAKSNDRSTSVQPALNDSSTIIVQYSTLQNNIKESNKAKIPPALNEVESYCKERGNSIDPQKWYDHYTANGWMVGRTKMKDWRAAVRTWERNGLSPPVKPARPPSTIKDQDGNDIMNPEYKLWRKENPHD